MLDTPPAVTGVDVALDLVEAGRFGGPSPTPSAFAADAVMMAVYIGPWIVAIALAAFLIVWTAKRRRAFNDHGQTRIHSRQLDDSLPPGRSSD